MLPENIETKTICQNCGKEVRSHAQYCPHCGKKPHSTIVLAEEEDNRNLRNLIFVFVASLLFIFSPLIFKLENFISQEGLIVDISFCAFAILFSLVFLPKMKSIYHFRFKRKSFFKYFLIQLGFTSFILFMSLNPWTRHLFYETEIMTYQVSKNIWLGIFILAVFPAITEELIFRGMLFHHIFALSNKKTAILTTAILFGFVHFSLLSYLWIVPYGYFLAWVRWKEDQLWYGMFFHFFHNLCVSLVPILFF